DVDSGTQFDVRSFEAIVAAAGLARVRPGPVVGHLRDVQMGGVEIYKCQVVEEMRHKDIETTHVRFIRGAERFNPDIDPAVPQPRTRIARPNREAGARDDGPESQAEPVHVTGEQTVRKTVLDPLEPLLSFGRLLRR